jgi:hypothetical protein
MEISKPTRKWVIWIGLIGIVVLTQPVRAESFNFSGSAQAQSQYDGITGKEQSRPVWVHTFSINPSFNIFGIPLDIPILLSTLQSSSQPFKMKFFQLLTSNNRQLINCSLRWAKEVNGKQKNNSGN